MRIRKGCREEFKVCLAMYRKFLSWDIYKVNTPEELALCKVLRRAKLDRERGKSEWARRKLLKCLSALSGESSPFLYNIALNELEIIEKKVFLESKPRQLGVNLTHRCNIHCRMCFYPQSPWDLPENTVREIKQLLPYLQRVFWQGGEPFVSPFFKELFAQGTLNPNLRQTIVTNGLLIDEEWADKFVTNRVSLVFSIDGITEQTYEYIRTGGRFAQVLHVLDILLEKRREHDGYRKLYPWDFEMILQVTVMKYNYRELEGLVDFAIKHKFRALNIIPIQNVQGEENIFFHHDKDAMEYIAKVMPRLQRQAQRARIRFQNQLPDVDEIRPLREKQKTNFKNHAVSSDGILSCYWPWYGLFILFEGRTKPYGFCRDDVEWNLTDNSLQQIWNNRKMQTYREKIIQKQNIGFCEQRCTSGIIERSQLGTELK